MLKTKDGYAKVIGTSYLGSSDYLLLSNGDSKAISSLSVNYATSAGNADTLDGVHLNGIFTTFLANSNATRLVIGGVTKDLTIPYASLSPFLCKNSTFNSTGLAGLQYYDGDMSNTTNNNSWSVPSSGWHLILHLPLSVSGYFTELSFPVNDVNGLAWRLRRNSSYYGWYRILDSNNYSSYVKKIGTSTVGSNSIPIYLNAGTPTLCSTTLGVSITGNAATTTTLKTTRTLWGLSFNGSANVSGSLSGVGHIQFSADNTYNIGSNSAASKYIYTHWLGAKSGLKLELGANNSGFGLGLCIDTNLNVGIGTNTPAYKLDVKGDIRATGLIVREAYSSPWVNGRSVALLRETTSAGYHTLWSLKTTNGSWDFGEYKSSGWNNIPVLSYITDTNFNSSNNTTTYQIRFPLDSGTIALTKNIPTSLPANGGNADTVDGYHANGLLTALSNSNNGISITVGGTIKSVSNISVNYASSAGSTTKVIVHLNTTADANYPLVWSDLNNTNLATSDQLFKSWSDLYYNPKNKRLTVGGSVVASSFVKSGGTSLQLLRADGGIATFNWSGQSGLPTWLWGGNNLHSYYVYNPSNFRVAYASSAGNADTLDGLDSTKFLRQVVVPNNTENDFNTFSNMTLTGRVDPTTGASLKNAPWSGSGPGGGYGVLTYLFNGWNYGTQMAWEYGSNRIYIRNRHWGGSGVGLVWRTSWDTLALTSDIPSSLKNPYALTLKANGTTLATYDGSSTKEANFTYANVGAAPASHTHTWTSITDKVIAGNEFNIVNAGFKADLWFNYRPINDTSKTAAINSYYFGNGHQGLASIKASGFIKNGSSDSYVLLGGGGHQTISSLSVNHASSAGNADKVDGYHATSGNNKPWGTIPVITAGGYMDIGKHLEFHYDNTTGSDYSTILRCTGNYANIVNLPSASGTLALKSDIPTTLPANGGNADTLDGTHLNGIFTAFGNNDHNITATIGGVTKSFLVNWAADADKLDGYHADKYLMVPTTIDATSLNSDTYYPVTIWLPCKNTRIEVEVSLDSGTKPSWSTHQQGFTSRKVWESNGSGWGTTSVERNIFVSTYSFASEDPIRGIGQLTNSSVEFVYVRGGGKYYFRVSVGGGTPTLRKENYTINSQSVAPTKTAPDLIVPCINTPHRRVTLWGLSFDGTNNVSGSLSNTGTITASAAATYDIGSNTLDYRNGYFQWIGAKSNTNLRLAANNSDNQIVLHTNGNVGIGTASPAYKLHVVGDIYTTTGFKKNGSSNSYILLGGGGHKLISDFATSNHTHSLYLPLAGGTMTGTIRFNNLINIGSAIVLDYKYSAGGFARDIVSMKNSVYGDANLGALSILCYPDSTSNGFLYIYLGTDKYDGPNNLRIYKDKVTFGNNRLIDAGNIGSLSVAYASKAGSVAWGNITGKPSSFTPSAHDHNYVLDIANNSHTTFAYSKSGLSKDSITWLAVWNGYELRAMNKDQVALSGHTHDDRYLKLTGGTMTGNISYKGSKNTYEMIRFVDNNADVYGNGICIGGGGLTIISGGDSASSILSKYTNGGEERMIIANDIAIDFFSNMDSGWDSRKAGSFDTSGYWNGAGFKKNNSNDNYVLTGGGGHKAISSLSVNYAASAGYVSNSLNIFGVSYNGSAAKTVTTSTFVSLLEEGTSTVTDGTMFITSYASNSGFADTSAVNVPYKRKASCLWSYIDSKVSSKYLPLAGGTMNGNARIGHGSGNLYIGNSGNDGWIYTQDIASLKGTDKWWVKESGAAHFGDVYICSKNDGTYDSSIIECYTSNLYLNYYSPKGISLCNGGGTVQIGSYTTGDTGNNKLYVNGSEFINGASNVKDHVYANGFRHRSHNSDDAVLLAGGGYSQGVPVRYWAIYYMYIGNSSTDVTYTRRSGNYNFITSEAWESEGSARFDISFPSGYNKNNTLIFGNGNHRTSSSWKTPVYVTITTSTEFGSGSQIRVMISNDSSLDTGFANIYFMCMG